MPMKNDREYRFMPLMECRANDESDSYIVEGYASTFEPYEMGQDNKGTTYYERIDPEAYNGSDMNDVLFLYNHEGQVMARQKNGSLQLDVDEKGLHVVADLSGSARAREMYEEIRAGLIDQMSFAFTVADESYDRNEHTRIIKRFRKLFDVSAVSIPANSTTSIATRSWVDGVIEQEEAERLQEIAAQEERAKLDAQIERLMAFRKEEVVSDERDDD